MSDERNLRYIVSENPTMPMTPLTPLLFGGIRTYESSLSPVDDLLMMPATLVARIMEMMMDDKNGYRRTQLRNDEKTEGSSGFFSGTDGDSSRSRRTGKGR